MRLRFCRPGLLGQFYVERRRRRATFELYVIRPRQRFKGVELLGNTVCHLCSMMRIKNETCCRIWVSPVESRSVIQCVGLIKESLFVFFRGVIHEQIELHVVEWLWWWAVGFGIHENYLTRMFTCCSWIKWLVVWWGGIQHHWWLWSARGLFRFPKRCQSWNDKMVQENLWFVWPVISRISQKQKRTRHERQGKAEE